MLKNCSRGRLKIYFQTLLGIFSVTPQPLFDRVNRINQTLLKKF